MEEEAPDPCSSWWRTHRCLSLSPPPLPSGAGDQLFGVGAVQRRLTVRATDASYQKACQNMAQAEEETRRRGAIVIKEGGRVQSKTEVLFYDLVTVAVCVVVLSQPSPSGQLAPPILPAI